MQRTPPFLIRLLLTSSAIALGAAGCTKDSGPVDQPATIFDQSPAPARSDRVKINSFILRLEQKYRRESTRNPIDLHFGESGEGRIKIKVTYDRKSDPTTASSIADAAVELAKRLKREDPEMRDVEVGFDRELSARDE